MAVISEIKFTDLPEEYEQVEYLESTGTQYIDTGVIPSNTTGFKIRLSLPDVQQDVFRFGCRQDAGDTRFVLGNTEGGIYFGWGLAIRRWEWKIQENVPFEANLNYLNSRKANMDGLNDYELSDIYTNFTYSLIMFGRNNAGNITSSAQKIYGCKISNGEQVVRDFKPCYRKSDNVAGMYDLVEQKFYTNSGTGEFAVGSVRYATKYNNETIRQIYHDGTMIKNLPAGTYHFAKINQVVDGVCENAVNEPLIDMQIQGNSIQDGTPTPETPIEVQSVGERTKNLFDKDDAEVLNATFANTTITEFEGRAMVYIKCEPNTTYTISKQAGNSFSVAHTGDKPAIGVKYSGFINFTTNSIGTITTDDSAQYLCIVVWGNDTISVEDMLKTVQIEKGTTATEYEPYGYNVPIELDGKNIFVVNEVGAQSSTFKYSVKDGIIFRESHIGAVSTSYLIQTTVFDDIIGTTTLKAGTYIWGLTNVSGKDIRNPYIQLDVNGKVVDWYANTPIVLEQASKILYIRSALIDYEIGDFQQFKIRIERGTELTKPLLTNIHLSEPLRKIGDYADYIDYKNKKVVRNIKKLDISGLTWRTSYEAPHTIYYCVISPNAITDQFNPLCNILGRAWGITSSDTNIGVKIYNKNIVRARPNLTNYPTLEDWKNYLANNSVLIYYALATPTEEAIEIPEISTFDGTNVFDTETTIKPSQITVDYWKQI